MAEMNVDSGYKSQTATNYGTVTTPAAGAAITSTVPLAGWYVFQVYVAITGTTVAATDTDNMEFREGGSVVGKLPILVTGTTGVTAWHGPYSFKRYMNGTDSVSVNATALATTGAVYRAQIKTDRVAD